MQHPLSLAPPKQHCLRAVGQRLWALEGVGDTGSPKERNGPPMMLMMLAEGMAISIGIIIIITHSLTERYDHEVAYDGPCPLGKGTSFEGPKTRGRADSHCTSDAHRADSTAWDISLSLMRVRREKNCSEHQLRPAMTVILHLAVWSSQEDHHIWDHEECASIF